MVAWPVIHPFVWFLFYPAVFLAPWLGGMVAGIGATLLSTGLVWWFFMEPMHTLLKPRPGVYINAAMFTAMGMLFAYFHHLLRQAQERAAAAELRDRDLLLDRMSRTARIGGWAFDPATGLGSWTEEVARIHDLDPQAQPTVEMGLRYYAEEDRPVIAEAVRQAVEEARSYDLELRLVSAKGVAKWVRTLGQAVVEKGRVVRVQGAMQDITDRKGVELALRDSEARFRSLFEQAGVGVVEVDALTGRFVRVNGKFCAILGYAEAELLAMTFTDVTHPDERSRDFGQFSRVATGELGAYTVEKRYLRKDGTLVWGALTVRPMLGRDTEARHLVSVVADITARKLAEAELRDLTANLERRVAERTTELQAANQELESFAYAVSHDLRAPLRAMDGFSQALMEDCGPALTGDGPMYADQIIKAARRMSSLIDGLLVLSRATRGDLERGVVDVSALASAHLADLAAAEPGRAARCAVEPGILALGDGRMLGAALGNLLGNAWKYTGKVPEAVISLDTVVEDGRRWIRVADNGCGFDMAYADKLFKPFQRLHRQDEFPGLGIGLATVHRIVGRHGGELRARSAPGQGATFLLSLPTP